MAQRPLEPGARLRLAREAKGYSVHTVAEATKLGVRAIEALEGGRLADLPGGIYRRAMVRSVAREVGLEPEQLLREFSSAYPQELPPLATPPPAAPLRRGPSSLRQLFAVVGALVPIAAGVFYFGWARPETPAADRAAYARRPDSGWHPEIVPAGGFLEAPPVGRRPVVVTLTVTSTCNLRVMADGREVLARVVEPGELVPVELGDELLLTGDNAGAVQFSINGQAGRLLGAPGEPLAVRIGRDDYEAFLSRP
jgi:cytoskeleton protein RodZ